MAKKTRGSEKTLFFCDKRGKRSLADFKNIEEALQASGGMQLQGLDIGKTWWRYGHPDPTKFQNFNELQNVSNILRR